MDGSSRVRFVFEGIGTRGDIAPLIAVGAELARRGHDCHLLTDEAFAPDASAARMRLTPIAGKAFEALPSAGYRFDNYLFPGLAATAGFFRQLAGDRRPTVIINADRYAASNLLCERYEMPACRLYLTPFKLRSLISPPWPLKRQAQGLLGRTYLKHTLPRIYAALDSDVRALDIINRQRRAMDLEPVSTGWYEEPHVRKHIALFPAWYCEPVADWPSGIELAGFPLPRSGGQLPEALNAFIEREGRPVVFTPGTSIVDVEKFFVHARQCCDELRMPGVFLSRHLPGAADRFGSRIMLIDYVELELLLKRSALLVHFGGIGTLARALEAGIPQVIAPLVFDQPDNGHRIQSLGLGRVIEQAELSGQNLATAARLLLDDPVTLKNLGAVKQLLAHTQAVGRCADGIERELTQESSVHGERMQRAFGSAAAQGAASHDLAPTRTAEPRPAAPAMQSEAPSDVSV